MDRPVAEDGVHMEADEVREQRAAEEQGGIVVEPGPDVTVQHIVGEPEASARRAVEAGEELDGARRHCDPGIVRVDRHEVGRDGDDTRRLAE